MQVETFKYRHWGASRIVFVMKVFYTDENAPAVGVWAVVPPARAATAARDFHNMEIMSNAKICSMWLVAVVSWVKLDRY